VEAGRTAPWAKMIGPGMSANPVIDMDVIIAAVADLPLLKLRLGSLGYEQRGNTTIGIGAVQRGRRGKISVRSRHHHEGGFECRTRWTCLSVFTIASTPATWKPY
jgi:hypothetical protein